MLHFQLLSGARGGLCVIIIIIFRMPKKMKGENPKAVAARERKEAVKTAAAAQHQKEIEDAQWRDDDKAAARKGKRKVNF